MSRDRSRIFIRTGQVHDRLVKVADFGLAVMMTGDATKLTRPGMMLGTPLYMAPEQIRNQPLDARVDARADIYSLGIIMYEMFTGNAPYTGADPVAILFQHVEGKAVPPRTINPNLPSALEAIMLKAMAVDPEQRFQSMEAFEQSLLHFLQEASLGRNPVEGARRCARPEAITT